jgi:hypothetical protein
MRSRIRMSPSRCLALAVATCAALSCKSDNPAKPSEPTPQVRSEADLIATLARVYNARDTAGFAALLHPDYVFRMSFDVAWCRDTEICTQRRTFEPQNLSPSDPLLPVELQVTSIDARLSSLGEFAPAPQYYRSALFPSGLDRERWRVTSAAYNAKADYRMRGGSGFRATSIEVFYVANDLAKDVGDPAKFLLYRWSEDEVFSATAAQNGSAPDIAVEDRRWGRVKALYRYGCVDCPTLPPEPPVPDVVQSEGDLIEWLARAYAARDLESYAPLLAPDFRFTLIENLPGGVRTWNRDVEMHVHARMFDPAAIPSEDPPLPPDLWLSNAEVTLTRRTPFTERVEYYRSPTNPNGLDPSRWRATSAAYATSAFFQTQGNRSFQVTGGAYFSVIQDLQKTRSQPGRFLLYRWFDAAPVLDASSASRTAVEPSFRSGHCGESGVESTSGFESNGVEQVTWSRFKAFYAK